MDDNAENILKRHPSLRHIITWLEAGEDWVVPKEMANKSLLPVIEHMKTTSPPAIDQYDAKIAAAVMNAINASSLLMILDWLDANPETDVGALFLDDATLATSFRSRLRRILLILLRGELLYIFFGPEHRKWIEQRLKEQA